MAASRRRALPVLFAAVALARAASADVTLPAVIGDGMVLQQKVPVPIWGRAEPGEEVTVRFGGQSARARADAGGRWRVSLSPLRASAQPAALTVQGRNTVEVHDVLVGEVWVASGQSNMQFTLAQSRDGAAAAADADHPRLRLFHVARLIKPRGEDVTASWKACTPESAAGFSAVAYYFGLDLLQALDVPVGLIHTSWGGTQAEAWTPEQYLTASEVLRPTVERSALWERERPQVQKEFDAARAAWKTEAEKATSEGRKPPREPTVPDALRPQRIAGSLYDSMVEPLVPFAIHGVIWYQGESNEARAEQYRTLLPTMIRAWRERWGSSDLPFGIVQLPNYRRPSEQPTDAPWAHLRDAQLYTFKTVPRTGLVVTIDVGEAEDIHPPDKREVGERLARWALGGVYGRKGVRSGPVFGAAAFRGREARLRFTEVGKGLRARDGGRELHEFWVAGDDHQWRPARARIDGKHEVVVFAPDVPVPRAVRYAWCENPLRPDLTNSAGLPASPFRTDDWPGPTDGKR
jgi:sialate O-acetylesterase